MTVDVAASFAEDERDDEYRNDDVSDIDIEQALSASLPSLSLSVGSYRSVQEQI